VYSLNVDTWADGGFIRGEAGCFNLDTIPWPRIQTATWSQGQPPVQLPNASDAFCALTRMKGHFAGSGEMISIYHNGNTQWLGGTSYQAGVEAQATCFFYAQ
jgi:hypothetical protein